MKKATVIIPQAAMVKFQMDKAIREGRLHKYCFGTYGEKYVKENFCQGCSHFDICKREKKEPGPGATC